MNYLLPEATSANIIIGPFLNATDAKTPETGLAGSMTVNLIKQGGSAGARSSAGVIVHLAAGWYFVPLNATDTGTRGNLIVYVDDAAHLPVWRPAFVTPLTIYGTFVNGDNLPVNVLAVSGDATAADNLEAAFDGTGYAALTNAIRDAVHNKVIESQGSITQQQALSIILAAVAGVTSNDGKTLKTPDGVATRITGTVTGTNRSAVSLNPSS